MFGLHNLVNPALEPDLKTTGGLLYYQYDGVNNVTETTDRHGDWIERYRYDAFGGIFTGITAPYNMTGFTSQTYDQKAGLLDMNARWYDPSVGRFLQQDSWPGELSIPWTQNRYAYVGNNPVNMWDPTGNVPEWVWNQAGHADVNYLNEERTDVDIDIYSFLYYEYDEYDRKVGEIVNKRDKIESWKRTEFRDWYYNHIYIGIRDDMLDSIDGPNRITFSDTRVYNYTITISARDMFGENQEYLRTYGDPPEVKKSSETLYASYSSVNGIGYENEELLKRRWNFLASGNSNTQILQSELNRFLNDTTIKEDGKFGGETQDAIEEVQHYFGVSQSGIYDSETMALLERGLYAQSQGIKPTSLKSLGFTTDIGTYSYQTDVINEYGGGISGTYFVLESGDVFKKVNGGYEQVAYLPQNRTGGVEYLDSMFEGTILEPLEYLNLSNAVRKAGTKAIKRAFKGKGVSQTNIGSKIEKQMGRRGWNQASINNTVNKPYATREAVNKSTGNKATAYFNKDGSYVVRDNVTGDIIQVSNRNDPNWIPDVTIVNPYIP